MALKHICVSFDRCNVHHFISYTTLLIRYLFFVSDCQRINIEFPFDTGSRDIQCENKTVITITNITVTGRNKTNPCILNTEDEESIKGDCDGQESCVIRTNWTSDCLWEHGYYTFTYTCRGKVIYNVMICLQPSNSGIFIHIFQWRLLFGIVCLVWLIAV